MSEDLSVEEWLAVRRAEAKLIDPATTVVGWDYGQTLDPYGLGLAEELWQVGRNYFARRPGGEIWVSFHDLPIDVCKALWKRRDGEKARPIADEELLWL